MGPLYASSVSLGTRRGGRGVSACIPGLHAPVWPLRDGGVDVVVGVSLMADAPYARVRTLPQVLVNTATFALRESSRLELSGQADVVLRPDLSGRAS